MDTGDAIALYAAVVATGAALWPVWQAHRARRPPVEVALTPAIRNGHDEPSRVVVVEIRNHGPLAVYIRAVGLTDGRAMWTFQPGKLAVGPLAGPRIELEVDNEFPYEVPPQETTPFVLSQEFVDFGKTVGPMLGSPDQVKALVLDLHRPLQAWVWLATGQTVTRRGRLDWSEPFMLRGPDEPDRPA